MKKEGLPRKFFLKKLRFILIKIDHIFAMEHTCVQHTIHFHVIYIKNIVLLLIRCDEIFIKQEGKIN